MISHPAFCFTVVRLVNLPHRLNRLDKGTLLATFTVTAFAVTKIR
jgi:hypothetical protein